MGLDEKDAICLCFAGHGYELIVLKLVRILKNLGYKPYILDHTKEHRFYYCIPHIDGINPENQELDIVDAFYRISVLESEGVAEELLDLKDMLGQECIFELYDYERLPKEKKLTVIVTDEHRWHLEALKSLKDRVEGSILVFNDYCGAASKKVEEMTLALNPDVVYALPFSDRDYKISIMSEYTWKKNLGSISSELRKVLDELIKRMLPDIDDKALKRAYRT